MKQLRQPMLIFDGACGFCTWAARFSRRRLPSEVRVLPWQLIDDPSSVGLTPGTISEAAWWIDADGRPHRGHRAIAESVRAFGGAWSVLGRLMSLPPLERLAAGVYSVVARNRSRLPGSTPAWQEPARNERRTS